MIEAKTKQRIIIDVEHEKPVQEKILAHTDENTLGCIFILNDKTLTNK